MTVESKADWIAVDWGTSNLRAYAMQGATVLERKQSDQGMGGLTRDAFETVLQNLIDPWISKRALPVIACGMVGSRQGWVEAPYRSVPCAPLGGDAVRAPTKHGLSVHVIAGLSQARPPDVMRGEETQIAGVLALNPGWDGVVCLPGTHTKWAEVSAGEVVSFQTFMTGELFALLGEKSVLRHTVSASGWSDAEFVAAVDDALSKPERLAARLFRLRADGLLHETAAESARAALSGYLIGAELAAARPYWLGQNIAILGAESQARAYQTALSAQGVSALLIDNERATLAGLTAAHRALKETT